jgi:hypothetical protein
VGILSLKSWNSYSQYVNKKEYTFTQHGSDSHEENSKNTIYAVSNTGENKEV